MTSGHWQGLYRGTTQQEPLSPRFAAISAGVRRQIVGFDARILLLGVTPMLSDIGADVTAVDCDEAMVKHRWPGDTPHQRALVADWLDLPFAARSFSACVGDGSINVLHGSDSRPMYPDRVKSLYDSVARVLAPRARFVCRGYLTPEQGESCAEVAQAAWRGECRSFLYFKFRLAMAIATETANPNITVRSIASAFDANFPDRDRLAKASGWDRSEIEKIDVYKPSSEVYNFPTPTQTLAIIPPIFTNARLIPVGGYEMSERCPLLVMERS